MTTEHKDALFQETLNTVATNAITNKTAFYFSDFFKSYNQDQLLKNIDEFVSFVLQKRKNTFLQEISNQLKIKDTQSISFEIDDFSVYKLNFCINYKCGFIYEKIEKFSLQATNEHMKDIGINGFISINYDKEKKEDISELIVTLKNIEHPLTFPLIVNEVIQFFKEDIKNRFLLLSQTIDDKFNYENIETATMMVYLLSQKSNFSDFYSKNKEALSLDKVIKNQHKWISLKSLNN